MASQSFAYVKNWKQEYENSGWWHSFDLPDGRHIKGVCSVEGLRKRLDQFPIPADLTGKRVLDIGAWDGWYTFEMERRGADVMAVDCWDNPKFHQMHAWLKSRVDYRQMDVYDLTPDTVGRFDIVLFMGVLYHLKHPLLALERVCALTTEMAAVDSFVLREQHRPGENVESRPVMEFYETDEFGGQTDNWCGLSVPCLMAMCRTAGFARVEHRATLDHGACVACFRTWEPESAGALAPAPELLDVCHLTNYGMNFRSRSDEYVAATFRAGSEAPSLPEVMPQAGGFGVRPLTVSRLGTDVYRADFKLPPGLAPGWHDVTIRLSGTGRSAAKKVAVDVPLPSTPIRIAGVSDGGTWEANVINTRETKVLAAWVGGLPENADRANITALLDGRKFPIIFVEPAGENAVRQVNIQIDEGIPTGTAHLRIRTGAGVSPAVEIAVVRR